MNNCIYFKIRSKNYTKYFYCIKNKQEITYDNCKGCQFKKYKEYKPLKKITRKQAKLERNRWSIFADNFDKCIECGRIKSQIKIDKHEIFRGKNRTNSIEYGLVIPLCRICHNSPEIEEKWRLKGYNKFVELHGKEKFIEVFKYVKGVNL